jgi:hypothetical protein
MGGHRAQLDRLFHPSIEIVILSEGALAPQSKDLRFARDASTFRSFQPQGAQVISK